MDEIGFVLKSFLVTCFLVYGLQMPVGGATLETHIQGIIKDRRFTGWMQDMGTGATRMTASTYDKVLGDVFPRKGKEAAAGKNPVQENIEKMKEGINKHHQQLRKTMDEEDTMTGREGDLGI